MHILYVLGVVCLAANLFISPAHALSPVDSAIQQNIGRQISESVSGNIKYQLLKPELKVDHPVGPIRKMALSQNGDILAVVANDNVVRLWDLNTGIQRLKLPVSLPITTLAVHGHAEPNIGSSLALGFEDGEIQIYDATTGSLSNELREHHEAISSLAMSKDGTLLSSASKDGVVQVFDLAHKGKRLMTIRNVGADIINALALSSDNKRLMTGDQSGNAVIWEIPTGHRLQSSQLSSALLNLDFTADSQKVAVVTRGGFGTLNLKGNSSLEKEPSAGGDIAAAAIAHERGIAVVGTTTGQIKVVDINSSETLKEIKTKEQGIQHLAYAAQTKRIISAGTEGQIHLWDASTGDELLQIVLTRNGWAIIDTHGRFDASEQGMSDVSWSAGGENIKLAGFSKRFFEPGLLAAHASARGAQLKPVTDKITDGMALPPKMEIDFPEGPYDATRQFPPIVAIATDQGGGVGEIRLYHNGKLVDPGSMLKVEEVEAGKQHLKVAGFVVKPIPGLNTFTVVGTGLWDIESYSEKITKTFTGPEAAATLHIVSVGINRYSDARLNLNYSVADATSIVSSIKKASSNLFQSIKEYSLTDNDASKDKIVSTLRDLAEQANPEDVIIVYLAGHGLAVGDEWEFMPYETTLGIGPEHYAKLGISASSLEDILVKAKAQRIFLLIDACKSGATTETFREQQRFQRRFLRDLSRTAGITVLAAARKDQEAAEMGELGHGLFTYTVLSALEGKADLYPADGLITAHEIAQYATEAMPDLAQRYINYRQEPMAFLLGADFKLSNTR